MESCTGEAGVEAMRIQRNIYFIYPDLRIGDCRLCSGKGAGPLWREQPKEQGEQGESMREHRGSRKGARESREGADGPNGL